MSEEIYKTCRRCGRALPIEQFGVANNQPDGHNRYCRECMAAFSKESNARRKERKELIMGGVATALSPLSNLASLSKNCDAEVTKES